MPEISLNLRYHSGQDEVFFASTAKRRLVAKGRRWGFTRGAAQFVIEQMLDGVSPILWGDTIVDNIRKYVERYFLPILSQIPQHAWEWKKQEKVLKVGNAVCDFRSADQPENWEGFGYRLIVLNEAGIILREPYLWQNAVRPMLMDYPDSVAIIGGTPKGQNFFHELWATRKEGWQAFQFSSYQNPFLDRAEIDELVADHLPASVVRQEIYADFSESTTHALIPYELLLEAMKRTEAPEGVEVWGVDVARHGDDFSVLAKRSFKRVREAKEVDFHDTMQLVSWLSHEYQEAKAASLAPAKIFVEVTGMGWGVYDRCKELALPVYPADVGLRSAKEGTLNKRAEMYVALKEDLAKGLALPDDRKLLRQLSSIEFEFDTATRLKLVDKKITKKILGESPDRADAVALTYFEPVEQAAALARSVTALMDSYAIRGGAWA